MANNNYYQPGYSYTPAYNPYQNGPGDMQKPLPIQNGGLITASSEDYARNYPVAPGTNVLFLDANLQYLYSKTMSHSPLDQPTFEKYRIIKEDSTPEQKDETPAPECVSRTEFDDLLNEVKSLRNELNRRKSYDKRNGDKE